MDQKETQAPQKQDKQYSNTRLRHLLNSTPSIIYSTQAYGDFACTFINDNVTEVLGYDCDEILANANFWLENLHEADKERVIEQFHEQIDAGNGVLEYRFKCKSGEYVWIHDTHRLICDEQGFPLEVVGSWTDITEKRKLSQKLVYQETYDKVTGLVNRVEFEKRLQRYLDSIKNTNHSGALCYLDIDQFKVINDSLGHLVGDHLLCELGKMLSENVRYRDTLARLGGDEFGLILENCELEDAEKIAQNLRKAVEDYRFYWQGKPYRVGVSIGITRIDKKSDIIANVLREADSACFVAKDFGRNRVYVYCSEAIEVEQRHHEMKLVAEINEALEEERFELDYQLIVPANPAKQHGLHYEVLVRMLNKEGKRIPPGQFLGAAEHYGLAARIDKWVVQATLAWLQSHPEQTAALEACSVNLSGHSFCDPDMVEFLCDIITTSSVDPRKICFEITETAAVQNIDSAIEFISSLRELGCRFALDDFGSGFSSFGYLGKLPIDYLKIDGSFVKDIAENHVHEVFVRAINDVGHVMQIETIAEFVEDKKILDVLQRIGVDYAQGYGIAKPQPLSLLLESGLELA